MAGAATAVAPGRDAGLILLVRGRLVPQATAGQAPLPHKSLARRATPATACQARPKAAPGSRDAGTHDRVRTDRIHAAGTVTLRTGGRLRHIGVGRAYAGTSVLLIIQDLNIRIINAATGELLRELTLNPTRDYQPTGQPPGPQRKTPRA